VQQFTVPQFIDVEDKIIGPITTRQFVILLGAFVFIAIFYRIFDFSLFATVSLIFLGIAGTFAFGKINGRPFHFFVLNLIQTMKKAKFRIWNNQLKKFELDFVVHPEESGLTAVPKKISGSRLAELSLIVDTSGNYRGEIQGNKTNIKTERLI
jgi:hypothetical protein